MVFLFHAILQEESQCHVFSLPQMMLHDAFKVSIVTSVNSANLAKTVLFYPVLFSIFVSQKKREKKTHNHILPHNPETSAQSFCPLRTTGFCRVTEHVSLHPYMHKNTILFFLSEWSRINTCQKGVIKYLWYRGYAFWSCAQISLNCLLIWAMGWAQGRYV